MINLNNRDMINAYIEVLKCFGKIIQIKGRDWCCNNPDKCMEGIGKVLGCKTYTNKKGDTGFINFRYKDR